MVFEWMVAVGTYAEARYVRTGGVGWVEFLELGARGSELCRVQIRMGDRFAVVVQGRCGPCTGIFSLAIGAARDTMACAQIVRTDEFRLCGFVLGLMP